MPRFAPGWPAARQLSPHALTTLTPNLPPCPGMMSVHITPNLEISNAFSAFAFALINLMCGEWPLQVILAGWSAGWSAGCWLNHWAGSELAQSVGVHPSMGEPP